MRAFGLLTGDVDLFEAVNDFSTGGTLAYYSFEDERITIRGEKLTPAVRGDPGARADPRPAGPALQGRRPDGAAPQGRQGGRHVESDDADRRGRGDAERVETLYRDSLKPRQRKALDAADKREARVARKKIMQVPKVIMTMMTSPYTLGAGMVQTVATNGGNTKVYTLFRDLPENESALLDPFQALTSKKAAEVDVPELEGGEKKFDSGEFGALAWYLMLRSGCRCRTRSPTVDGWGGDSYVGFERKGNTCARLAYKGDTPQDTKRMLSALRRWGAAAPGPPTKVAAPAAWCGSRPAIPAGPPRAERMRRWMRSTSSSPGPPSEWG